MMTREEIRAVYDQGPEAVIALVEHCTRLLRNTRNKLHNSRGGPKDSKIAWPPLAALATSPHRVIVLSTRGAHYGSLRGANPVASRVIRGRRLKRWLNLTRPFCTKRGSARSVQRHWLRPKRASSKGLAAHPLPTLTRQGTSGAGCTRHPRHN